MGFNYLSFWNCHTLFKTEHVLVKTIKPFTCTLSYCFLEIDLDHSKKVVKKRVVPILHLQALKRKSRKLMHFKSLRHKFY